MKSRILLIPLLLSGAVAARAQSVGPSTMNSAGSTAIIGTNRFDWSVGEMTMVSTFSSSNIVITQGLLQPYEKGHVGVQDVALSKQLKVYPNPASSVVNIAYDTKAAGTLTYRLMDMNGKTITQKTIDVSPGSTEERINIATLACATYMLNITTGTDEAKSENISYKIEKIK